MNWLIQYVGLAIIYAIAGTGMLFLFFKYFKEIKFNSIFLFFTILFFLILTQHPLPDRVAMICPISSAAPQLVPFKFLQTFVHLYRYDAPALDWLANRTIAAAAMNFVLCAAIGAALVPHVVRRRRMLAFGLSLTLLVETTQLTGAWGLYPCAWRKFDVDDLIMNVVGVAAGWAWMRCRACAVLR